MERTISTVGLIVIILVAAGGIGASGYIYLTQSQQYELLSEEYQSLFTDYNNLLERYSLLQADYDELESDYQELYDDYQSLSNAYDELVEDYDELEAKYNAVCEFISSQILPLQTCNWAEAVRRTHLVSYLDEANDTKSHYLQFAYFCRDLVLHASGQKDSFSDVSDAFSPALKYGNDTMRLADRSMRTMAHDKDNSWDHFPYRWGWHFTGIDPECYGINKIVQDCIDNIEYEYDEDITYRQDDAEWDYPKHPVETAFRMMGDCEDQAILCASYLEMDYFESGNDDVYYQTALCLFHDEDHRDYGEFYHMALAVHIEDTDAFWDDYPSTYLWHFGSNDPYYDDYTWCFVDPTWDTAFGSHPAWLDDYIDNGISFDDITIVICDIDGQAW